MSKKQQLSSPLPSITPNAVTPYGIAMAASQKAKDLKSQFLPAMPNIGYTKIINASYPAEILSPMPILDKAISSVIKKLHPFKAASNDCILLIILKCLCHTHVFFLQQLFQACINFS
jgi:hypothetical protein